MSKNIFIDACFRKPTPYTPIWMMRQAGRYLSEYQEVRHEAGGFLNMCKNPSLASKVTLQPIDVLDVDAAILFSDILMLPHEMGLDLVFENHVGPKFLEVITSLDSIKNLKRGAFKDLNYVYETISLTRAKLDKSKALIGFCGAPWTLATYMIEGQGSKSYAKSKKMLYSNPETLHALMRVLTSELKGYLDSQIKAGADAVMLFDSWANALEDSAYMEFGFSYMIEISEYIKREHPRIPVILFPRGTGNFLHKLNGNFDVLGVDYQTPMEEAKHKAGSKYVLQGNLEPARLYDFDAMKKGVEHIIEIMGKKEGHIFNLGHGMLPDLPRENAIKLVELVRTLSAR
ncbi:uroporphyrinogen decarboxylase [Helicobacter sp. 11S02629-2]|nr:uroporphyrinogen decarboxylase [Helicobacter sp. 11S02629-2]